MLQRLTRNIRRLLTPRRFQHMVRYPIGFLRPVPGELGAREIRWRRKTVGRLSALDPLRNSDPRDAIIVASGPSIATIDFAGMRSNARAFFALNGSIVKFREQGLAPDYYVVVDRDFPQNRIELMREAAQSGAQCFYRSDVLRHICEQDAAVLTYSKTYLIEPVNHRYGEPGFSDGELLKHLQSTSGMLLHSKTPADPLRIGFSMDLEKGSFHSMTVVHAALQVAYYLGMKRVFVFGMDLGGGGQRFYEKGDDRRPSHLDEYYESHIVPTMELVRDMRASAGFEVYNVSPESRLPAEILPKISVEEARRIMQGAGPSR